MWYENLKASWGKNDTNQKDEHVKDYYDYKFRLGRFYVPVSRRYHPIPLKYLL